LAIALLTVEKPERKAVKLPVTIFSAPAIALPIEASNARSNASAKGPRPVADRVAEPGEADATPPRAVVGLTVDPVGGVENVDACANPVGSGTARDDPADAAPPGFAREAA
jgi:hypothetical protein